MSQPTPQPRPQPKPLSENPAPERLDTPGQRTLPVMLGGAASYGTM